jgi:two-component system, NarL family, response regulator NreC
MSEITLLVADDHPIVRQGLRALLEKEADFRLVGEASEGLEAVDMVKRFKPKVLILDLMMPGINGMEVTRQVKKYSPHTHIIILSMYSNEAYVIETMRNGAEAYVLKDSTGKDLVDAVRSVIAGRNYLSPPLSEKEIESYMLMTRTSEIDPHEKLTAREREVLSFASAGYSNAEIAGRLSISQRTVEVHRANMMHKLGLRNQTELIRYAIRKGILSLKQ